MQKKITKEQMKNLPEVGGDDLPRTVTEMALTALRWDYTPAFAIIPKLLAIYHEQKWAPLYFKELAQMRHVKSSIDIDRRRLAIQRDYDLKLPRDTAFQFFKALEALKLGRFELVKDQSIGNSKFHWDYKAMSVTEMAKEVIKETKGKRIAPEPTTVSSEPVLICKLSSGKIFKLDFDDVRELKKFIREIDEEGAATT